MPTDPVIAAFAATVMTWALTAAGAAAALFMRSDNSRLWQPAVGFAGGVMCAASFWSLLSPAVELAESMEARPYVPVTAGFVCGCLFLALTAEILQRRGGGRKDRDLLLVLSVTLHNLPEGLAVGVAFGAAAAQIPGADMPGAWMLAIGIALQNLPEGFAVAAPLRRAGYSRGKSLFWGQFSGLVEPVGGVLGALLVQIFRPMLPFALSFAAGAMIWVVFGELAPECGRTRAGMFGTVCGFALMMLMDLAL
ncbi:MAG: ZIP family metal transporter [Clostridia bacterium]|nr:ZIP family metal transporter [Clostridia bacterium]